MERRQFLWSGALLGLLALTGCRQSATSLQHARAQFGWIFDAHHTGFIVASRLGLYDRSNLSLELLPGGSETNPIRMVVSSAAQFGQAGGIEQLVTSVGAGLPVRTLASIHRKSPHALISTERAPIRSPSDIRGKTIAVAFGDTAEILLKAFMKRNGIGSSEVTLVPFRFDLTPLLRGDVHAVTGFRTDQPATIMARGQRPVTLLYDDFGVSSYGYTLFCTQAFQNEHAGEVAAFLNSSRAGWVETFGNPDRAIDLLGEMIGAGFDRVVERKKLDLIKEIMVDTSGNLSEWNISRRKVEQVISYLVDAGQLRSSSTSNLAYKVATAP